MQIQAKNWWYFVFCGILYNCGVKLGSNYPDLEAGKEFWIRVQVHGSDYKSLITVINQQT